MSYLGERDRFFERILCWPVGEETIWVSIGGGSRLMLKDSGKVAGLHDVSVQSDYPRNVVKLEQIMDGHRSNLHVTRL